MPRRLWWENTKSRKSALAGAIVLSLVLVAAGYWLVEDLIEGGNGVWKLVFRIGLILIGIYTAAAYWTNWYKLRQENK